MYMEIILDGVGCVIIMIQKEIGMVLKKFVKIHLIIVSKFWGFILLFQMLNANS